MATALSLSPDSCQVVVAGRDLLRCVSLTEPSATLETGHNLLAQTRKHINLSSNDVQWRPQHASQLVTGASTGDVLLWDCERRGDSLLRTMRGNSRAVNRLCFSQAEPAQLLVAANERAVRLWDVGQRLSTQQLAFATAGEVRDVQFSPHTPTRFAVALENGMAQVFDVRSNKQALLGMQAHQGPVYCLEWHPEERGILATGGRDRTVRVWDIQHALPAPPSSVGGGGGGGGGFGVLGGFGGLSSGSVPPGSALPPSQAHGGMSTASHVHTLQTLAAVSRLKWRPGGPEQRWQLASCAIQGDCQPHVWDAKRPAVALYSCRGHKDVCTGIAFLGPPVAVRAASG